MDDKPDKPPPPPDPHDPREPGEEPIRGGEKPDPRGVPPVAPAREDGAPDAASTDPEQNL
jgi:hypothetical protein